jgi:predicted GIY-YIG superfamily endonuclease
MFYVYLLECSGKTYVGATVDVDRRLRQHNAEIKGGAIRTTREATKGGVWKRVCYVKGFPTWKCALQFEWRWKNLTRTVPKCRNSVQRRLEALNLLLASDRSTKAAIPFSEYKTEIVEG